MPVHATKTGSTVPPSSLGTGTPDGTKFLRDDGVWSVVSGGAGLTDGDKGEITVASSGAVWTIDAGVVTSTKMGGDVTTAGKNLIIGASASAQRTTLGLGTAALSATGDFATAGHNHTGTYQPLAAVLTATTASYTVALDSKLTGIATGATANSADATLLARANHTGTQLAATVSDFSTAADARITAATGVSVQAFDADLSAVAALAATAGMLSRTGAGAFAVRTLASGTTALTITNADGAAAAPSFAIADVIAAGASGLLSGADKTKLNGIATGATANSADATLLARANHTGTQAVGTITGLATVATSASAADITAGTMATARLGSGAASASTYLRGDQTWATPSAAVAITATTITVPYEVGEYLATVTDAAVSGTSKIILAPGLYAQTDQNSPADIDAWIESVAAGSFGVRIAGQRNETIGGEFKFFYTVG